MQRAEHTPGTGIFETGTGFYHYTGKIFDLIAVSVFWVLGCIPVVTAGASSAALYDAVSRSVREDIGTVSRRFWKSFKGSLKTSVSLLLIFGGGIFWLLLCYGVIRERISGLSGLFFQMLYFGLALLAAAAANYAFPALSRFEMPFGWILKLSFYLVFRHLPRTLALIGMMAGSYLLLLVNPLVLLILPGVYALLASMLIEPVLEMHMPGGEAES